MPSRSVLVRVAIIAMTVLTGCSGFTAADECAPGDTSTCTTVCGPGTMECLADGTWGECSMGREPECMPGDFGSCELAPDAPPGLWFCSDDCRQGPCRDLCLPGETHECQAQCGPGVSRCQNDGSWGECLEYVLPFCRPGDVERCPDGVSHRRCDDQCQFGPCDEGAPCTPGEVSECGVCASQVCQADSTWSACSPDIWATCAPDTIEECEAPCGPGRRACTDECVWTPCTEIDPVACHPGDRQMCPTTLYCGIAHRVCNAACEWGDCIETGE
jgi:hypothetical protein